MDACAGTGGWPFSRPMFSSSSTCSPQRPRHAPNHHRRMGSHGRLIAGRQLRALRCQATRARTPRV
uniref:Uncharacterized protein n=1 Tax=Setaria viridis TaxID=4556 RepID=A0A4V6D6H4_SETVI|nr:hypothetical protein SEVIR_5G163801v2 [Setaria viridis]